VDAFRADAFPFLYEDAEFRNESRSYADGVISSDWGYLNHTYTWCQPELIDILTTWREFLDDYEEQAGDGEHRFLMTENYCSVQGAMTYYGNESFPLADFPINFQFLSINLTDNNAYSVYEIINEWATAVPDWAWPNWLVGNHDNHRVGSETRMTPALVDGMNMMVILLQGTPTLYYGEELGMVDNLNITYAQGADPQACNYGPSGYMDHSRDAQRTPFQWNDSVGTGFTNDSVTPWLPVNANHVTVNVENEDNAVRSQLTVFRQLIALRETQSILSGSLEFPLETADILSFTRHATGYTGYLVLISFTADTVTADISATDCCDTYNFPVEGTVVVASVNSTRLVGDTVAFDNIVLSNYEALVIEFQAER
jgi:glycosidase